LVHADDDQTVAALPAAVDAPKPAQAAIDYRTNEQLEERGELDAMLARYGTLGQYVPGFFRLPLQAAAGSGSLLQAIETVRALDAGARTALAQNDPCGFVPADWRPHLVENCKVIERDWATTVSASGGRYPERANTFPPRRGDGSRCARRQLLSASWRPLERHSSVHRMGYGAIPDRTIETSAAEAE
jgi:hypothetical protein